MFNRNGFGRCHGVRIAGILALTAGPLLAQDAGLPWDAPKEEYVAALADMEPVLMQVQAAGGPGANLSSYYERYSEVIEEWSGGKITFDIAYGSAIQRGEASSAIADGRLAYGSMIPAYKPSEFPMNAAFTGLILGNRQSPLAGTLQAQGAALEAALNTPELFDEMEDFGIRMVIAAIPSVPMQLFCSDPRSS